MFPGDTEVVFDTTGFWLPASVSTLASFRRVAYIAAPLDGMVNLPALNLYRRGGPLIGVDSLLYSPEQCARQLREDHFPAQWLTACRGSPHEALVTGESCRACRGRMSGVNRQWHYARS